LAYIENPCLYGMLHYPHTNCIVFTGVILPPQPCSISQGNSLNLTIHSESILLRTKINEVPCTTPEIHYHDWMIGWKIPQKFQEENTPSTSTTTLENPPSSFHLKIHLPPTSNIQHPTFITFGLSFAHLCGLQQHIWLLQILHHTQMLRLEASCRKVHLFYSKKMTTLFQTGLEGWHIQLVGLVIYCYSGNSLPVESHKSSLADLHVRKGKKNTTYLKHQSYIGWIILLMYQFWLKPFPTRPKESSLNSVFSHCRKGVWWWIRKPTVKAYSCFPCSTQLRIQARPKGLPGTPQAREEDKS